MEIIQDTLAINQEFEYNQEQLNDLLKQQTETLTEGLEDDYAALDELDVIGAMENFSDVSKKKDKPQITKQKDKNFDSMLNDLLN